MSKYVKYLMDKGSTVYILSCFSKMKKKIWYSILEENNHSQLEYSCYHRLRQKVEEELEEEEVEKTLVEAKVQIEVDIMEIMVDVDIIVQDGSRYPRPKLYISFRENGSSRRLREKMNKSSV